MKRALLTFLLGAAVARAEAPLPPILRDAAIDQRLGEQVPLDLVFTDDAGKSVRLGDFFSDKPVILVLAYYRCPMLCNLVLNGLVQAMLGMPLDAGREFEIVTVSFDPRETPALAAAKKKQYLERYGRPGAVAGWHFLTGEEEPIRQLCDAVGFHAVYDARRDEFAHASGIMLLTPGGKVARYLFGVDFPARDLRLGLVEASEGKVGTPADRLFLFCYHYDPNTGRYGAAVMNLVRLAGAATALGLSTFLAVMWRRERRAARALTTG